MVYHAEGQSYLQGVIPCKSTYWKLTRMRLALPTLILFVYIVASMIWFLPCRFPARLAAGAALFAVCLKYLVYEKIGGSFIAPDLPRPLLLSMEVLYAAVVLLFFMLLIKDGLALLLWLSRCLGSSWQLPFSLAVRSGGLVLTAVVLAIFGTWQSLRVPDVRTVEIRLPNLPARLDGFSIVQLSDIHIGSLLKGDWLRGVVMRTNALAPDLVALTGDMIDGSPDALKDDIAPLGELHAKYGVYGVTGNHEYYFRVEEWLPVFEKLGIVMLHNEHRVLSVKGEDLVLAGLPDHSEQKFGGPGPDIRKALEGAPEAVRVLLAHRPQGVTDNSGADIQLSGHTHGGLLLPMKILMATFNGGFVGGLYDVGDMKLYVSPGTGLWSGFSCRVGVPSEITHIVLRTQKSPLPFKGTPSPS